MEKNLTRTLNQIRFFSGFHQDFAVLEDEINQWLTDNLNVQIVHMAQCEISSEQGRDIVVAMLYKKPLDA